MLVRPEQEGAAQRTRATLTPLDRFQPIVLRGYPILAVVLVIVRVMQVALRQG